MLMKEGVNHISATVKTITVEKINTIAKADHNRSFSSMVDILLAEAVEARESEGFTFKISNKININK